jgi:hypothetical protein
VDLGCSLGLPLLGSFSSLRICLNSLVPLLRPPQPLPMPDRARAGSSDSTAAPQQQPTEITGPAQQTRIMLIIGPDRWSITLSGIF